MIIYECDGCFTQVKQLTERKPLNWYQRTVKTSDGKERDLLACCRHCIKIASEKYGTDRLINPI